MTIIKSAKRTSSSTSKDLKLLTEYSLTQVSVLLLKLQPILGHIKTTHLIGSLMSLKITYLGARFTNAQMSGGLIPN